MSDKDIKNWETRLKDQVLRNWENYQRKRINLDTARISEFWGLAGEFLYVEEVSSISARAQIRLNRNTNPDIDLRLGTVVKTIFQSFFLTHDAQPAEWIDLIVGINFDYHKHHAGRTETGEAQACVVVTNVAANTNTVPAARISNRVLLKADVANIGVAWIDFGTAAVQNACLPLDPGDTARFSLSNLNRLNVNLEIANERLIVVPEV